jgi:hypothetical protein
MMHPQRRHQHPGKVSIVGRDDGADGRAHRRGDVYHMGG